MTDSFSISDFRLGRIRSWMTDNKVQAFLIRKTTNIAWATGFRGVFDSENAHALLVLPDSCVLHTDSRYITACKAAAAGTHIFLDSTVSSHASVLAALLEHNGSMDAVIAVEDTLTVRDYRSIVKDLTHPSASWRTKVTTDVIEGLRSVKDKAEIDLMKRAQAITDAGFDHIIQFMRPGMTERQVQLELDRFMLESGADGLAFDTIIATGDHAASPHAQPGDRVLTSGEAVVMDFGARYAGYCSDMTRTVFLGKPEGELLRAWKVLRRANEECEQLARAGCTGREVHEHAEAVLAEGGFGGAMGHALGHSVGLDIHETPVFSPRNNEPIPAGAVITIEPGIYLEGRFGMRLEDFGVITKDGYDVLTKSSHEMVIIDVRD